MKKVFLLTALCCCWIASSEASAQKLTLLHTNDTHSHMDPERNGSGGVIERAAFIDSVRTADGKKNVLLLDAGDWSQGSSYFTILKGDLEVEVLNAMAYDAVALGNHEFDNGIDELCRRVKTLNSDVLCCNYDFSSFSLGRHVKPYAIYKRGGFKIGVIGLLCDVRTVVTAETASKLVYLSPSEQANRWAEYLKEKKYCDIVIALSHLGVGRPGSADDGNDCGFAAGSRNIDIVVGGHSHANLTEPIYVNDLDGKPVMIVQDYRWGVYVGQVDLKK